MKNRNVQSIGINLSNRCNAECEHCCVNSGPRSRIGLSDPRVISLIDEAIAHPEVNEVGFTGGEPLLRRQFLLDRIRQASNGGLQVTCVTNGFWANSVERAHRILQELSEAGLSSLTVSYDDFHSDFVSPSHIRNLFDAAKSHSLQVRLNMAVGRYRDSLQLLNELGDSLLGVPITRFPIIPAGRAEAVIDDSEFIREPIGERHLRCPGFEVIYHNDGRVLPCCSPGVFDTSLAVGQVDSSLESSMQAITRNGLLAVLQREGLGWFRDQLAIALPSSKAASVSEVVSACELCSLIFSDDAAIAAVAPAVMSYCESLVSQG